MKEREKEKEAKNKDKKQQQQRNQNHKMVLVVRQDLGMKPGKIAAQCAHAAVGIFHDLMLHNPTALEPWLSQGQAKVVVKGKDLSELQDLQRQAKEKNIPSHLVIDAGRTQVSPGSATVLAIGPGPAYVIDEITGHLKLF